MTAAPAQPSLFDRVTPAERRKERERLQARLEPIALQLADRRGAEGIIAADVISEAVVRGLWTGAEGKMHQRAYSWVGPWLRSLERRGLLVAKLVNGVRTRRHSERNASHGNWQLVYVRGSRG